MGTNKKPALHEDTASERVENIIFNRDYEAGFIDALSLPFTGGFYDGNYGNFSYQVTITSVGSRPISDNRHDSGYQILRHEFVHYLDHRFNGNAGFPWVEGVAEYLSKENDYEYGIKAARREMRENGLTISDVFNLTLGRRVDYSYSIRYAVIRFFFERYPELIAEWLHGLYKVDTYGLLPQHLQPIGSRYDKEFADWLENVTANNDPLPRIKRKIVDIAAAAVPFMLRAHNPMGQGFVRIINEFEQSAGVRIPSVGDGGNAADAVEVELGASQALHFNSNDLEQGNPSKGIAGVGSPQKNDWKLGIETDLGVRVLSYVRTTDGFLTAMHDTLPRDAEGRLAAQTFNPGSNANQASKLRLVNTGVNAERVSIGGVDDQGRNAGPVALTLAAGESRTLSALELETGSAQGLTGTLGDGGGKWRLFITAGQSVYGLSLLEAVSGHLTNISTMGVSTKGQ